MSISSRCYSFTLLVLLLLPLQGTSQTSEANLAVNEHTSEDTISSEQSFQESTLAWVTTKRNEWSRTLGDTGKRLDGFFADTDVIEQTNNSFLKLALRTSYAKRGELDVDPIAKFRLDLPALEERFRFTIENEPVEGQTLEETSRENILESSSNDFNATIASFKYQFRKLKDTLKSDHWQASTSVGIDFDFPSDYFWRAKGRYNWKMSEHWNLRTSQNIYYFHREGWGEKTRFQFERDYISHVFRISSEAKYTHKLREMGFSQRFSILKELSTKRAINLQLGVLGSNRPNPRVTAYYTNTTYRRRITEDWLFYEMTPELLFARDDHFKASPSLTVKLEIVFSSQ